MSDDLPATIFVSESLVEDIHDVNLGWGSDLSYDDCHRGLSIFATAHKTKKEIARLEKKQEHVEKSSYVSPRDIAKLDAAPPMAPTDFTKILIL
eukprot:13246367-Ditylum_brightwellii.AAC.1